MERDEVATAARARETRIEPAARPSSDRLAPSGLVVPGFELIGELGRGGSGTVYAARQLSVKRLVAIKVVSSSPELVARARHEAEILAALRHPAISPIHDLIEVDGALILVLPLYEGGTLEEHVARCGRLPAAEVVATCRPIAEALDVIHDAGVVHRDVKPANVFLDRDGGAHLGDFGLAIDASGVRFTEARSVVGTIAYLAPELQEGGEATDAADTFALGVTAYECLTGALPYEGSSITEAMRLARKGRFAPVRTTAPGCPPALAALVERALDPDPNARPLAFGGDLGALALAEEVARPEPIRLRPMATAVASSGRSTSVERGADRVLEALDETGRAALRAAALRQAHRRGATIFRQGEPGASMYLVERGRILIQARAPDGSPTSLTVVGAGGHLGELALVAPGVRTADAIALDDVETLRIDADAFEQLVRVHPEVEQVLLAALAGSLRRLTVQLSDLRHAPEPLRVVHRLQELALGSPEGATGIGAEVLADLAAVPLELVDDLLAAGEARGAVRLDDRGCVTVDDPDRLADLAEMEGPA